MILANENIGDGKEKDLENQETNYKPPLFSDISFSAIVVGSVYILGLSLLLSFFYKAGKYSEYVIPFYLLEASLSNLAIIASTLGIASLSAISVAKLSLPPKSHIRHRTRKITDFFAAIASLAIGSYFITIISLLSKNSYFPLEAIYLFIIYGLVIFFYFMKKNSHLGYNLVSAGFIIILLITSFYLGKNIAKTEDKLIVTLNDEAFGLVATYNDNIILSGYTKGSKKFNGKMKIINQESCQEMVFIRNKN